MSMTVAKAQLYPRPDAAQLQKGAGSGGAKAGGAAKSANSGAAVVLSRPATAAMARPAQAGGGTNSPDGAKARGGDKLNSTKTAASSSPRSTAVRGASAALIAATSAYGAAQPNAGPSAEAAYEEPEAAESTGTGQSYSAPDKAKRDNVMATYSSLSRVSMAADVRYKREI